MKRVWSGSSLHDTTHFHNLLEQAGIACVVKNRELTGALGDLPVFACGPELWVLRDDQVARAEALLVEAVRPAGLATATPWRCSRCGADNERQFAACWSCSTADEGALA